MVGEETTFEINSSMLFVCDEYKKHEAMITDLNQENLGKKMQNSKLKNQISNNKFQL